MPNLWKQIKSWFKEADESSSSRPYIHELIERSDKEKQDYESWKNTLVRRRLIDWLNDQYAVFLALPAELDESVDFLNTPSSKGFVIHFHQTSYSRRDVMYFFDYLREMVLKMPYKVHVSDLKVYTVGEKVEKVERHYLKPRLSFSDEGKIDQRFGNIQIEFISRDEKPHLLKFQATVYRDHKFSDADSFRQLMEAILI